MAGRVVFSATLIAFLALSAPVPAQQDALAEAKTLYGSAAYDEALAILDRLQRGSVQETGIEIALYRMFCLVVLDRREEAVAVIRDIVEADPFFVPSSAQASPRIRAIFDASRRAMLPAIVRHLYTGARDAFTRKDLSAAPRFETVLRLLDDPGLQDEESLADLRLLASEFQGLIAASASLEREQSAPQRGPSAAAVATEGDADVVPPVPVSQPMPAWSPVGRDARQTFIGEVEVVIDERGNVTASRLRQPIHPEYDEAILRQSRSWRYRPATRAGIPTRFLKVIRVHLAPPA